MYTIETIDGFEFDLSKSDKNLEKHGIDFFEATHIWKDEDHMICPARSDIEERSLAIGKIDGKVWSAVFTHRGKRIRIISARSARDSEVELYDKR